MYKTQQDICKVFLTILNGIRFHKIEFLSQVIMTYVKGTYA